VQALALPALVATLTTSVIGAASLFGEALRFAGRIAAGV